ncbi:alpha/beta hydrolase [Amycolatopsis lurida]
MVRIGPNTKLPARREAVTLHTEDGLRLVGELALPVDRAPVATVVLLHPLPTHGGMMDSHVLRKAAFRLPALAGLAVLRFNTRGAASEAGRSEGTFGAAEGERFDVAAALDFVRARGLPRVWLAGWSFGSDLALMHGIDSRERSDGTEDIDTAEATGDEASGDVAGAGGRDGTDARDAATVRDAADGRDGADGRIGADRHDAADRRDGAGDRGDTERAGNAEATYDPERTDGTEGTEGTGGAEATADAEATEDAERTRGSGSAGGAGDTEHADGTERTHDTESAGGAGDTEHPEGIERAEGTEPPKATERPEGIERPEGTGHAEGIEHVGPATGIVEGIVLIAPPLRWSSPVHRAAWAPTGKPVVSLVPEFDDYRLPEHVRQGCAMIPQARVITLPGAGHLLVGHADAVLDHLVSVIAPETPVPLPRDWDGEWENHQVTIVDSQRR